MDVIIILLGRINQLRIGRGDAGVWHWQYFPGGEAHLQIFVSPPVAIGAFITPKMTTDNAICFLRGALLALDPNSDAIWHQ